MKKHERLAKKREKREQRNWRKVLRRMPPPWAMTWRPSEYYDRLATAPGAENFYPLPESTRGYAGFTQGLLEDWLAHPVAYQRVSHIRPFAVFRRVK
jgi:hypothetical protein